MENNPHSIESPPSASLSPNQAGSACAVRPAKRRRTPPEVREALLEEFESLGISAREFARRRDLCYQTLLSWLRRRRGETRKPSEPTASERAGGFAEILLESGAERSGGGILRIELPGGASLEVRERAELPAAVELLTLLAKC